MARTKTQTEKPALHKSIVLLSTDTREQLARLTQECSDALGRSISGSAVLRGLLRVSTRQSVDPLVTAVEAELQTGTIWGSRPKKGGEKG
jgi:hypothetical protein